jgi:hypothetical protein
MTFRDALAQQRWDDHRYYHHSRVNQSLHLFSACCFVCAYTLLWSHQAAAVFVAWALAMPARQIGHFFFEPRDYDVANQATHEYKEEVKVGYNLRRKVVLMSAWALSPLLLLLDPTLGGLLPAPAGWMAFADNVATIWLVIGVAALAGRTIQLFFIRDVQTGLVWCTKILTDPFHDVMLYRSAPIHLLRGEWFDPIVPQQSV